MTDVSTYCEAPVHAEMDGDEDVVVWEEVDLLRPPSDRLMTSGHELWVEERVEAVDAGHVVLSTALHQQIHVEVDHLNN